MAVVSHMFPQSTQVAAMAYDDERQTLNLRFKSGRRWRYYGVPQAVAAGLIAAPSKGTFFNKMIRPRYFGRPIAGGV